MATSIRFCALAAVVGVVLGGAPDARAVLIDDFDALQILVADAGSPTTGGSTLDAGILGGERDEIVGYTSGPGAVVLEIDAAFGASQAGLVASAGTAGGGAFYWDGIDGTPFGAVGLGLGADLTAGGANALAVHVTANGEPAVLQFNLFTSGTEISSIAVAVPVLFAPTVVLFPFSGLVTGGALPADLTNIGGIELTMNVGGTVGPDLILDRVETLAVPEPAAALLVAASLAGLLLRRR